MEPKLTSDCSRSRTAARAWFRSRASGPTTTLASQISFANSFLKELRSSAHRSECPARSSTGEVLLTNVSWKLRNDLSDALDVPVSLINDLVATGIGIGVLSPDKLLTLSEGVDPIPGTIALIAAGTGLGESVLYWNGRRHVVQPCEGGQADFAPHDDIQIELLRYLRRELPVVCVERVLSGSGLVSIYKFLRETGRGTELPEIAAQMPDQDTASVIAKSATRKCCPISEQALDIFLSILRI